MKSKKINIKTIIIIAVIISLIFMILNMKNENITQQEIVKEQLGETTENNTYVEMQSHLSELNQQEQKLLLFKSAIATAITEMGVETSTEDSADIMANNIRNITSGNLKDRIYKTKIKYTPNVSGTLSDTLNLTMTKSGTFICFVTLFQSAGSITNYSLNVTKNNETVSYSKITLDSDGLTDRLSFITICDFKSGDIIKVTPAFATGNNAYGKFIFYNYSY